VGLTVVDVHGQGIQSTHAQTAMATQRTKAGIALYRAAQKSARKIDAAFGGLDVRLPLDRTAWQNNSHEWSVPSEG
jgi:hypothetical protein